MYHWFDLTRFYVILLKLSPLSCICTPPCFSAIFLGETFNLLLELLVRGGLWLSGMTCDFIISELPLCPFLFGAL